ncbi:MAG: GLUG motif-containing protein [Rikenellaceae bacterium]
MAANGVVKNLGVTGSIYCKIYGVTTDISGSGWEMGGIVSYNYGTVSNCYNSATISGDYNVGGVVGHNAAGALIENCYNRGDISGCRNIGGICGQNEGDVEYCYSTGEMTGNFTGQSDVSSDYTARVGGVVGFLYTSTTGVIPTTIGSFCLNNTTYSVGTGSSTSVKDNLMETITLSTCSGLNNNNAYQDDSDSKPINDGYPVLNWQVE